MNATTHDQECVDGKPAALRNAGGSSLSHDGQSVVHHVQIADGQIGQHDVPVPQVRATVDAAVQATPVHRRVLVQAVLLSPAPPQHQVKSLPCRLPAGAKAFWDHYAYFVSHYKLVMAFMHLTQPGALQDDLDSRQACCKQICMLLAAGKQSKNCHLPSLYAGLRWLRKAAVLSTYGA